MNMNNNFFDIIIFVVALIAIWYGYFYLLRDFALDAYRQKLFALRDQLFDDAANGLVDFNHPAYGLVRTTINGHIRYGHKMSFFEVVVLHFMIRRDKHILKEYSFESRWKVVSKGLSKEDIERLLSYRCKMSKYVLIHMAVNSPFFVVLLLTLILFVCITVIPVFICFVYYGKIKDYIFNALRIPLNDLESAAMSYGS